MFAFRGFRAASFLSTVRTPPIRIPRAPPFRSFRTQTRFNQQYQRFGGQRYSRFEQTSNLFRRWASRPSFYYEVGALGGAVGVFYIANLETVPVSGRRRFNVISPQFEEQLGEQQYQQILQEFRGRILSEWDPRVRMVHRVMDRLIPVSGLENQKWEIHVIDDDQINAFVLPGGKVFVFTKILPICRNDDGLATVLGHEIAHNVAHHAAEQMSSGFILTAAIILMSWMLDISGNLSSFLLRLGFELPNGRKQETEADYIGLQMMARACYDPEESVRFWERMQKAAQFEPPQLLSTHPSSYNRQQKLLEWVPEAIDKRETSDCAMTTHYADEFRRRLSQIGT